jgi:transposase
VCWKDTTARIKNFDPRVIMVLSRLEVSSIALVSAVDPLTRRSVPWVKRVGNGSVCGGVEMLIWRWVNIIAHRCSTAVSTHWFNRYDSRCRRGKGTKLMAFSDGSSIPLALHAESASLHEVTLVEPTLASAFLRERQPERLIGDKAYDSDPLDEILLERGIEMIAPHRSNRKKKRSQDGRKLGRYKRRWKVERLFAWLQNFRRLVVRYEYKEENFLGMAQLGCIVILLRKCL